MYAEAVSHFLPKLVELHNYVPANSIKLKKANWYTLNWKVLSKIGINLTDATIQELVEAKSGAIEKVLGQYFRIKVIYLLDN